MSLAFYRLFLLLYSIGIKIAALFNRKAKLWLEGRKNIFPKIQAAFHNNTQSVIWFHCASLGEFEQGRPLIEQLRKDYPSHKILLTFFSPSGYEVHKHYAPADDVFYLPLDSKQNASRFLQIVQPELIIFIKYEFWYFYLNEIKNRNISLLLVSAAFRKDQPFFKWYGTLHRHMLQCFTQIFVQDNDSKTLLSSININNVIVCGDTRVDRVSEVSAQWHSIPEIETFCTQHRVVVCGSTWEEDDEELNHYVNKSIDTRFIIAPHEIDEDRLKECLSFYKNAMLYSDYLKAGTAAKNINTIIIDNIGLLKRLYKYGDICFVGGGFGGDGVHNVLEPAVYHRPVVFGPVYEKYREAVELEEAGAAFSADNTLELEAVFNDLFSDKKMYDDACEAAANYINDHSGATKAIEKYIRENILK